MSNYIETIKQMIADGHLAQDVAEKYFPTTIERCCAKMLLVISSLAGIIMMATIGSIGRFLSMTNQISLMRLIPQS